MPAGIERETTVPPNHHTDAVLTQNNPVSGTPYAVLAATTNVRIISIAAEVTWSVQPSPLEIHVTIDGQVMTFLVANPGNGSWYEAVINYYSDETTQTLGNVGNTVNRAFLLEGRSIAVTAETTGGTVSQLNARVKYATW